MAFSKLMLTTSGRTLYAKAQQGKTLRFTRVGVGDGQLGSGSMVNRTVLISEKMSLPIDAIQLTSDATETAVLTTLKNASLTTGFYFRELGLFAEDPDTHQELLYLYDNAGTDGEYIPDGKSGVFVNERLKLLITIENAPNVTFNASGNPLYLVSEDISDNSATLYSLWSSTKISDELAKKAEKGHTHTPGEAGADPAGSAAAALAAAKQDATAKANQAEQNAKDASEKAGSTAAHNADATAHVDIRNALSAAQQLAQEAKSLAEGRSRAVSYAGYSIMVAAVNIMSKTAMRVGDNLLLEALGVPDLWVSKVEAAAVIYTYTTDEALEAALMSGTVQMGYYKLTMLETPKVDLSGYVPTTRTINGKPLTANVTLTAADVGARAAAWVPTPAEIGLGKTLTFTGAVTGTYDGTAAKTVNIPEGGGKRVARFTVGTSTAGWTAKDCDYLCDGTDDQVEINAAIQSLPATGGEVVILDGTYDITAAIAVNKANTKLSGNGVVTVLKMMWNSTAAGGVVHVTANRCAIADLMVDGNKANFTSINNYGICSHFSSSNTAITGNMCSNNYYGIYLSSSSIAITKNTCISNNYGIYLSSNSSYNNTIAGNRCNNGYGIYLESGAYHNSITGNVCRGSYGIYLESGTDGNTITGNMCSGNSIYGIYLNSSSNNTITGNTCNKNSNYGIYLNSSSNNTITGNTCNNNSYGICLTSSSNNTVTGNTCIRGTGLASFYTDSQHTIFLNGTSNNYNLIADNNIMGKNYVSGGGTGNTFVNNKYN